METYGDIILASSTEDSSVQLVEVSHYTGENAFCITADIDGESCVIILAPFTENNRNSVHEMIQKMLPKFFTLKS